MPIRRPRWRFAALRRVSDFMSAECFAVAVQLSDSGALLEGQRFAIEKHLNFARNLHIIEIARLNSVTQIFVTRPGTPTWPTLFSRNPGQKIIAHAKEMQLIVVSDREPVKPWL